MTLGTGENSSSSSRQDAVNSSNNNDIFIEDAENAPATLTTTNAETNKPDAVVPLQGSRNGPHMLSVSATDLVNAGLPQPDNVEVMPPADRQPQQTEADAGGDVKKEWNWRRLLDTYCSWCPCSFGTAGDERVRRVRGSDSPFNKQFQYCDNSIKTSRYNVFTFVPLNLFEQFMRFANVYFLILVILQSIKVISPISPVTTAVPLASVLLVTMIKDLIDDIFRYKSDLSINNRKTEVLIASSKTLKSVSWKDVQVGDILLLKNNDHVPADMLLLSSSESSGLCFIETAELDGETNLKYRQALMQTQPLGDDLGQLARFNGEVQCEPPNNNLTKFEGRLFYQDETFSLNNSTILLRGCTIRNTAWATGMVVFAGHQTKLMKNAGKSVYKRTRIDRLANKLLLSIFGMLGVLLMIAAILSFVFESGIGVKFKEAYSLWMAVPNLTVELIAIIQLFSYLVLIQTLIPISLYVTFEIIRLMISRAYINWDIEMYHAPIDVTACARTTTLNEELGQISYIFSDKTGTLTQNVMTFNKCSVDGKMYGDAKDQHGRVVNITKGNESRLRVDFSEHEPNYYQSEFKFFDQTLLDDVRAQSSTTLNDFFLLLALCHTINADEGDDGELVYKAQSPDEAALVSAARNFGYVYKSRTQTTMTIDVLGEEQTFQILCILDFDNDRKRMSVIVEKDGKIRVFCKGADTELLRLLNDSDTAKIENTKAHLNEFAGSGLRTLCCAVKDITADQWRSWNASYKNASTSLENRESQVSGCFIEMENDFKLIGATAVEDKLQEGVPETIFNLSKAGIKIWVLTGDKKETAINIGYSCSMLRDTMEEFIIDAREAFSVEQQLRNTLVRIESNENETLFTTGSQIVVPSTFSNTRISPVSGPRRASFNCEQNALIITGESLRYALTPRLEDLFLQVASRCQAVICCRVAPLQKGQVVDLVKQKKKTITLAIGDGANDVNMIKTAHIGVGISGLEGTQAVLSSDFSFGQFRFLQRLLLVHGRWSYLRIANFLRYFFYKNFAFTMCHFWFGIYCGWSATSLYDQWFITFYNVVYTSLPVINYAWIEQDINAYYSQTFPKLYYLGPKDLLFNLPLFLVACFEGFYASAVTFFFIAFGFSQFPATDGNSIATSYQALGIGVATAIAIIVNIRCCLEMSYWTLLNFTPPLSIVAVFVFQIIIAEVLHLFDMEFEYRNVYFAVWSSPTFWLAFIAACAATCFPVLLARLCENTIRLPLSFRVRIKQQQEKKLPTDYDQLSVRRGASALRRSRLGSGFAFSQQSGFGSLISHGVLRESRHSARSSAVRRTSTGQQAAKSKKPKQQDERNERTPSPALLTVPSTERN